MIKAVDAASKRAPGLFLGGNYHTGVAFGYCEQYGADVSTDVLAFLQSVESTSSTASAIKEEPVLV